MPPRPASTTLVRCPTCRKPVDLHQQARHRPFCSERCRLIDLGEWASEGYRLAGAVGETVADPENPQPPPTNELQ